MKSDDTAYNILHKRQETDFFSLLNKTSLLEVKYWTLSGVQCSSKKWIEKPT